MGVRSGFAPDPAEELQKTCKTNKSALAARTCEGILSGPSEAARGPGLARGSAGTTWGDKGFAYPSLAYAQDAFTEAYGVAA